jgi:hypothetical protein
MRRFCCGSGFLAAIERFDRGKKAAPTDASQRLFIVHCSLFIVK